MSMETCNPQLGSCKRTYISCNNNNKSRVVALFAEGLGYGANVLPFLHRTLEGRVLHNTSNEIKSAVARINWPRIKGKYIQEFPYTEKKDSMYSSTLAMANDGYHLLIADCTDNCVRVFDTNKQQYVGILRGTNNILNRPISLATVAKTGEIIVVSTVNSILVVFPSINDDTTHRIIGNGYGNGPLELNFPRGIAILDNIAIVADTLNCRIALFDIKQSSLIRHIGGTRRIPSYSIPGQFYNPDAIAIVDTDTNCCDEPWIIVTEGDHRIQIITFNGSIVRELLGNSYIHLGYGLSSIAVYTASREVLVTDHFNHRIIKWRLDDGEGLEVVCAEQLYLPSGIVIKNDELWVANKQNNVLCLFH